MNDTATSVRRGTLPDASENGLESRLFRFMIGAVAIAVAAGALFAPWRVTTGLLLGGLLALLNHHWLRSSIATVFNVDASEKMPRVKVSRYILRYLVIGAVGFAAYQLRVVSLPAMLVGLCAFVPALLIEASRQFYFAIIHREEIS